jgi:hypothetical protein
MPNILRRWRSRDPEEDHASPEDATLLRRLAELQDIELQRRSLPIEAPKRSELDREIAERSHRIVEH